MTEIIMRPRTYLAVALVATAAAVGCRESPVPSGPRAQQMTVTADTITGSGELAELKEKRAEWLARGIDDYRVELRISCFCVEDVRRPVLVEVRHGVVSKVWDLETSKPVTNLEPYPTITGLFDRAVELRSQGGSVSVAYDRALGFPVRIEIGTIANDAGVVYMLGELSRL
jgi:hypothetical protein